MMVTGFALVLMGVMTYFVLDDKDPAQKEFLWASQLALLMFISGLGLIGIGLVLAVWRFLA